MFVRPRRLTLAVVVSLAGAVAGSGVGCGLDGDGVGSSAAGQGGAGPDGNGVEGGGGVGEDVASLPMGDAAREDTGPCVDSGAEVCGNGVDDDCNGLADCADPACGAYACSPGVPAGAGWTVVAALFAQGTNMPAACPAGYGTGTVLGEGPTSSAATCSCACGGNPCLSAQASNVQWRTGSSNCNDGTNSILLDGACHAFNANASGGAILGGSFAPPGLGAASRACTDMVTKPGVTFAATVRLCAAPGPSADGGAGGGGGGGCTGGGSCEPRPAEGMLCIRHDGNVACPAGLSYHVVGAPGALTDNRSCGACGCAATACTTQNVGFYTDQTCQTSVATSTDTGSAGSCGAGSVIGDPAAASYSKYLAVANCGAASPNPALTGTVSFASPVTLCCPPQ